MKLKYQIKTIKYPQDSETTQRQIKAQIKVDPFFAHISEEALEFRSIKRETLDSIIGLDERISE